MGGESVTAGTDDLIDSGVEALDEPYRSEITVDLDAVRANIATLARAASGAGVWAVVKADAYGHGCVRLSAAALSAGVEALCVATLAEALELRRVYPDARIVVLGPVISANAVRRAREARLELVVSSQDVPEGVSVHVKLDTGLGRWGVSELAQPSHQVVGLMSHFACADSSAEATRIQIERFREATDGHRHLTRHLANSAGVLRFPEASFDAVRCGIALYGLSPFGTTPVGSLKPALGWTSYIALTRHLAPGESTGYGRRFVASDGTWIGIVPVGYADGFRRDYEGMSVLVGDEPAQVVGAVSMDALAVRLRGDVAVGTRVTLIGPQIPVESYARHSGTVPHEVVCSLHSSATRAHRRFVGG